MKTIWYFTEGAWHQVAPNDALAALTIGGGSPLETTDGTIDILSTTKLSIGTGLTLTNPTSGEAHLVASGGGGGIQFNTDPQVGGWLIVTTNSQTSRTFFDPNSVTTANPFSVAFEMVPNTSGSGRGMLVQASGDGVPQLHALDVSVIQTGGVAKGLWITGNTTGTPTLLVMGDTDMESSTAGLTVGWRSFIHATGTDGQSTGASFNAVSDSISGSATGIIGTAIASGDDATGIYAQATALGIGVGVDIVMSGASAASGNQFIFRGSGGATATGPEAYGLQLSFSQTGGGTTHLHPILINVNGSPIFRVDPNGNVHLKTGATVASDL